MLLEDTRLSGQKQRAQDTILMSVLQAAKSPSGYTISLDGCCTYTQWVCVIVEEHWSWEFHCFLLTAISKSACSPGGGRVTTSQGYQWHKPSWEMAQKKEQSGLCSFGTPRKSCRSTGWARGWYLYRLWIYICMYLI